MKKFSNLKELERANRGVIIVVDISFIYFGAGTTVSYELYFKKKKKIKILSGEKSLTNECSGNVEFRDWNEKWRHKMWLRYWQQKGENSHPFVSILLSLPLGNIKGSLCYFIHAHSFTSCTNILPNAVLEPFGSWTESTQHIAHENFVHAF